MTIFRAKILAILKILNLLRHETLTLIAILMISSCGQYEKVTEKFDFLKFENFNCDVVRVTSGESFMCQLPNREMQKITLAGVTVPANKEKEARKYIQGILPRGTLVKVDPVKAGMDEDGTIHAYVLVLSGKVLNAFLVEKGYADPVKGEMNEKYMYDFIEINSEEIDKGN